VELATRLGDEVLGRSLDELPPVTRKVLASLGVLVVERAKAEGVSALEVRFTQREVREKTGWGHTQIKVHMKRLEELEYVLAHRSGRGQSHVYELVAASAYDATWAGAVGPGRPLVGGWSGSEAAPSGVGNPAAKVATRGVVGPKRGAATGDVNGGASSYAR